MYLAGLGEHGPTQGEAHILAALAAGPATVGALHEALAHRRSTLTSILDRLAERGLITRQVGETDRRTFLVSTTPAGRRAGQRVYRHLLTLERAVRGRVSEEDLRGFQNVIEAIEDEAARRAAGTAG